MGLAGGLALFLYGMEKMTDALKLIAGDRMRSLLDWMTANRFKGVSAGAMITAMIQSSSVTTVLVVGFITAGLLNLSQAIGIILGSNIGTTITTQVVAFKVTHYALILVAAGFLLSLVAKKENVASLGRAIMGLGLLFFGMEVMKEATAPLRDYAPFIDAMRNLDNPLLGVLIGAAFTALVQSSSATTGVIVVLASEGFLSLEAGIALVLGANIGTCVTAMLSAIGKPREAVRAAVAHVIFNVVGVLIWIGLIDYLAALVGLVSPTADHLQGLARLKAEVPRQIANSHTIFNVANTALFIGFTPQLARLVKRLVPDQPDEVEPKRRRLDDILVHTPALGLDVVRLELARLGAAVQAMVKQAIEPVFSGQEAELRDLEEMDEQVDEIHAGVIEYLGQLSVENLTSKQSKRVSDLLSAANYFENIGDMIETNLVDAGRTRLRLGLEMSQETREQLRGLHRRVHWAVETATQAIVFDDLQAAKEVRGAKEEIRGLTSDVEAHLSRRLVAPDPNRLEVFRIETELVESLNRMYYFAKRVARLVIERHEASESAAKSQAEPRKTAAA